MKFENTEVWGFEHSIRGMRNPLESWSKSDSGWCDVRDCRVEKCAGCNCYDYKKAPYDCLLVDSNEEYRNIEMKYHIGKNDLELMQKLIRAGTPHRKFMRQIFVSVDITAPLYWWKEFDTYKVGTTANSTSTMHKLASTPITKECFEMDDFENVKFKDCNISTKKFWENYLVPYLERLRNYHNKNIELSKEKNMTEQERKRMIIIAKRYWKELIRLLPESWLQTRTITMNYENILNMIEYRKNHKLSEWSESFMNWAKSLPYANDLLFL